MGNISYFLHTLAVCPALSPSLYPQALAIVGTGLVKLPLVAFANIFYQSGGARLGMQLGFFQ